MKISDYFPNNQIIRDGEFIALGLSNSQVGRPTLSYLDDKKFFDEIISNIDIAAVICRENDISLFLNTRVKGILVSDNPRRTYFELHNQLSTEESYCKKLENTKIGDNCHISKLASIDYSGVVIGDNVYIDDFVKVQGPCYIGNNTIIHAGCVIGGNGFEFKRYSDEVLDVVHCGRVEIGDNVIIWENVTIHKAVYPWDSTSVGAWCRIGAQTHVDHGAKIDSFVEICARCTISGRTYIGEHAFIGPGSIVSNRISIGRKSKVLLGSVVTKHVKDGQVVSGNFAIEHDKHINSVIADSMAVLR